MNFVFSVHTRGIQLVPELLLRAFATLYTQCRDIEHLHKAIWYQENIFLTKLQHFELFFFWSFEICRNILRKQKIL